MPDRAVRILVVSDIHAHIASVDSPVPARGRATSWIDTRSVVNSQPQPNPFRDFLNFIEKKSITADYLICCGDIADVARPEGLSYGWQELHGMAAKLGAKFIGINGNHDLDSRHLFTSQAYGPLKALSPHMPNGEHAYHNQYFSESTCLIEEENIRFLLVDSCSYHPQSTAEQARGRISESAIERGAELLRLCNRGPKINICVTHHHPVKIENVPALGADYDAIVNGNSLIAMLQGAGLGAWLLVHGHKHYPKFRYAQSPQMPTITMLSAGSFSSRLWDELATLARNQCHEIVIHGSSPSLQQVGKFRSWSWKYGEGWHPASSGDGLPHAGGFGYREASSQICNKVLAGIAVDVTTMRWSEVVARVPDIAYLAPEDLTEVKNALSSQGWHCLPLESTTPLEIAKAFQ